MEKYYIIRPASDDGNCALYDTPEDLEKFYKPSKGKAYGDELPEHLQFHMAPEEPGFNVPDMVWNSFSYLIVSSALKTLLAESLQDQQVEYIPCSIINHKGRVAGDDYFVVNIIGTVDCVDMHNTIATPGMRKDTISIISKLCIFPEKVPHGYSIFRIQQSPGVMLVSESLKQKIQSHGFSGVKFYNLNENIDID